jgi:outer membrane protein insertion porin family
MMTRTHARRRLLSLALAAALSAPAFAQDFEAFKVSDIRIDGLQRISAGTVFTYLPVERGDTLDRSHSTEAIRALFKTGFFSDVKLERQGDILVVKVVERPAINTITLAGNKEIKTEELMKGLKSIGLSEGETYNPLNLDRVTQELTRQYDNRGKYNVSITPTVTNLDRNRVDVQIKIVEGKAARIRDINIVGNDKFSDRDIRASWESGVSNWLSWYTRDDQYSRDKLSGDLEKLSNFYLDRGYVDFAVDSTQVAISPTKQDMFITANVSEGDIYKLSDIQISGDTILPVAELQKLVFLKPGQTFSRQSLENTSDAITTVLSNIGYAFAEVNPIPDIDREKRTVAINLFIKPGPRVHVRRIQFTGNTKTADEVLRREMRQYEGAWYSQAALDRSKVRLQRTGFFEDVNIETPKVQGTSDQVDVVINVKERSSGSFQFGIGYSQVGGIVTSVQLDQINFLGTGNRFSIGVEKNSYSKQINFSYADPYFTDDGVSVGYNVSYSDYNQANFNTARYTNSTAAGNVVFGVPLTETDSVQFMLGIDRNQLTTTDGSTPKTLSNYLVSTMGERARQIAGYNPSPNQDGVTGNDANDDSDPSTPDPLVPVLSGNRKWTINAWRFRAGWARDSRNDYLLPSAGTYNNISAEIALPGSDLEYYQLNYNFEHYMRLNQWLILKLGADLGYGDSYGTTRSKQCTDYDIHEVAIPGTGTRCGLPFFKNYYAGGPGSLRGFQQNTLGPIDTSFGFRQPLGGAVKTIGSVEMFLPSLIKASGTRASVFLDYGNVFASTSDISFKEFRVSTGLALQWQSPLGPISISYSFPLKKQDGDQIERLQFNFGRQY